MKPKCLILVAGITAALNCSAFGQQDEKLGKLSFPTSCDPKVQAQFERGVAMIHSYWFLIARRTFEGILREDPNCAMAYWGIALDLLGNSLATVPSRADAEAAWAALEKARAIGAKTERERDWIEALSSYYRDHDKTPANARLVAYNKAMEQVAQRYPDDYEAQVFYALTLQASASPADTTYANQLKSAAILEKLYDQNPQHPGVTHFLIHGALELEWDNGKIVGVGEVVGNVLAVASWTNGRTVILTMQINPDGSLSGNWLRRTDRGNKGTERWKKT